MRKQVLFFIVATLIIAIDQIVKIAIIDYAEIQNPIFQTKIIDIVLVFNKGIAFSLGTFLGNWLKWILLILIVIVCVILFQSKEFFNDYYIPFGAIIGAGIGNLIDRFIHGGVVDYIYWHFGFKFAIFNFADCVINISIAYLILHFLILNFKNNKKQMI